jgi:perosamine synthetase
MSTKPVDPAGDDSKEAAYRDYMARIAKEKIPCYQPSIGDRELALVTEVIRSGWLSEGRFTRELERGLAEACGRKHAVCFSNATAALITGMRGLGIGPGDEVIVQSLAHSADPNAISATGAKPVFADIDPRTLCLRVETIDVVRTERTRAILFIAAYGNAAGIDAIDAYARQHDLYLINDCAPALFGVYKGRPIASYGDFSVLSFFADKTITTGEGGMLLTDRSVLIEEANMYKHDGRRERGVDLIERRGANYRITELQAAVGVAQLERAPGFVARKKEILRRYAERLADTPEIEILRLTADADIVPHRVVALVPDAQRLIAFLDARGIGARTLFMPMHGQPCYGDGGSFPATEEAYRRGVCLPSAPSLTDEQVDLVCSVIREFFGGSESSGRRA